jgi:pyruvate dehydrogenase E2 component (dihydrolipoamide acetyltransferase)
MKPFRMPSLGADMDAGTLVEWLKQPGDTLKRGDIIAVVETQKGAIEIEVFETGILDATLVEPGAEVPVGQVLATIRAPDEPPGASASVSFVAGRDEVRAPIPSPVVSVPPVPAVSAATGAARAKTTPLARRLPRDRGGV